MTRFFVAGGSITDRAAGNRDVSMPEAFALIGIWSRSALTFEEAGAKRMAAVFARAAYDLCVAVATAQDWLAAGGNEDARLARLARGVGG